MKNIQYDAADLSDFDQQAEAESFDFITTFDAVHDQAKPLNVLGGIQSALKPEGIYLMQISAVPAMCTRIVSTHRDLSLDGLVYALHDRSLAQGGEGLGAMWGEEKTGEYLKRAGFANVT